MNRDNLLFWTHNKANHDISACMPARTYSSSFLLSPQAVSHPSVHVTERWVHPVTGQLVAVTLIYVASLIPLIFVSPLVERLYIYMYAHSLLGRFTQPLMGAGAGAHSDKSTEKSTCVSELHNSFLAGHHSKDRNPKMVEPERDCVAAIQMSPISQVASQKNKKKPTILERPST